MRELPSGNAIVTCAVASAIHTLTMSAALPAMSAEVREFLGLNGIDGVAFV